MVLGLSNRCKPATLIRVSKGAMVTRFHKGRAVAGSGVGMIRSA
jgi:hypothetical protein